MTIATKITGSHRPTKSLGFDIGDQKFPTVVYHWPQLQSGADSRFLWLSIWTKNFHSTARMLLVKHETREIKVTRRFCCSIHGASSTVQILPRFWFFMRSRLVGNLQGCRGSGSNESNSRSMRNGSFGVMVGGRLAPTFVLSLVWKN